MSTNLVVMQDDVAVKVECDKASLIMDQDESGLRITLPIDKMKRKQTMRSQLPGKLSELLNIFDSRGEKQIYRILNELESGTDDILLDEEISRVSWLAETCRPKPPTREYTESQQRSGPPPPSSASTIRDTENAREYPPLYLKDQEFEPAVRTAETISISPTNNPRPAFRPVPEVDDPELEAPDYWKVLEHVRKQAALTCDDSRGGASTTADDITSLLESLSLESTSLDPLNYPNCFGDDPWLSRCRVGAAGELYVGSSNPCTRA
jgi:hypothetical protein